VPDSPGWPFGREELAPWYERAALVCELDGPVPDLVEDWRTVVELGEDPLLLEDSPVVTSSAHQLSPPTRFGDRYLADLADPPPELLRVLTGANVTALRCSDAGAAGPATVDRAEVRTLDGGTFSVVAPTVVLATGGIEVPRLLLSSAEEDLDPLPLPNDLVGRYFSDHLEGLVGELVTVEPLSVLYTAALLTRLQAVLRPSDRVSRDEALLATSFALAGFDPERASPGLAAGDVAVLLGPGSGSRSPATLATPASDGPFVADVHVSIETEPDRDSRVTLGDEVDELGMRRSRLDWRVSAATFDSLDRAFDAVADDLAARHLGRLRRRDDLDDRLRVGWHHMGTTRMHPDPALGVVDADGRVHGLDNLWIASSAVFPSAGSANPTLTIVALALRLADHLDGRDPS
jgi:choline dehydrogenase-like flavoprotein